VESKEGEGARFTVRLPMRQVAENENRAAAERALKLTAASDA
jgi:hypothetical protein